MRKIKVINMPMGTGKTTGIIKHMNKTYACDHKFLFITPFLHEVQRIKTECPKLDFKEPDNKYGKLGSLKDLIVDGCNIVSTHALFKLIDAETLELLKISGYTLILDEVLEVISILPINKRDVLGLIDGKYVEVAADGRLRWIEDSLNKTTIKWKEEKKIIQNQSAYLIDNNVLVYLFKPDTFDVFKDVYMLTYMFKNSLMENYCTLYNIKHTFYCVNSDGEIMEEEYNNSEFKKRIKSNIKIYEGSLNDVGTERSTLSVTWYNRYIKNKKDMKIVKNNMYNFFRHINKAKSGEVLWSAFKGNRDIIKNKITPNGYLSAFIPCNMRATNDYGDRNILAYPLNVHLNPYITRYFNSWNIATSEDNFALSQLLQWIWRSAIRNDEEIYLYLPSRRMRNLLQDFLDDLGDF